jgi:catechol 2,3-dioxygenase-like lactoylglutathione lyase family enzyme
MSTAQVGRATTLAVILSAVVSVGASAQGSPDIASTPFDRRFPSTARQPIRALHVTVLAGDDARLASWYVDHLGFRVSARSTVERADGSHASVTSVTLDELTISFERAAASTPTASGASRQRIALAVRDLPGQLRVLHRAGISSTPAQPTRSVQVRDPEGNVIELVQDRP